jgi:AcrR family transcriptional regulator
VDAAAPGAAGGGSGERRGARDTAVEAAEVEFGARGYFSTTLAHISVRAGVPLPVLKQLFPSKASIVVSALQPRFAKLRSRVDDDVALGLSPVDIVQRYLGRLASFAVSKRPYVEAFLMVVAHDTASSPETAVEVKRELNLPSLIAPVIETGQRQGIFSCAIDSFEAAAAITNSLLLRCFTRRDDDATRQASAVANALLQGLLIRTPAT